MKAVCSVLVTLSLPFLVFSPAASGSDFLSGSEESTTLTGTQSVTLAGTIDGSNFECTNVKFSGTLAEFSEQVRLHPTFEGCKAFGFVSATVTTTGCDFVFHAGEEVAASEEREYHGTSDIACESGKKITLSAATCTATIAAQTGITGITYKNEIEVEPEEFRIKFTEAPIAATKTVDGFACPFAGVGATTAHLTGQILTKGAAGVETVGVGVGRPTTLCDHNEAPCDEANIYGAGTLLEGESTNTTVKVEGHTNNGAWSITIGCAKAVFKANTNQRWGNPGLPATIQNFFFNSCAIGGNACTIAQVVWWNGRIFGDAANARYRFSAQRMRVTCNTWPLLCDFTGVVQAPISGGTPGSLSITPVILARQAGAPGETANCTGTAPTTAEFQGNYSLLKPSPLFVAQ